MAKKSTAAPKRPAAECNNRDHFNIEGITGRWIPEVTLRDGGWWECTGPYGTKTRVWTERPTRSVRGVVRRAKYQFQTNLWLLGALQPYGITADSDSVAVDQKFSGLPPAARAKLLANELLCRELAAHLDRERMWVFDRCFAVTLPVLEMMNGGALSLAEGLELLEHDNPDMLTWVSWTLRIGLFSSIKGAILIWSEGSYPEFESLVTVARTYTPIGPWVPFPNNQPNSAERQWTLLRSEYGGLFWASVKLAGKIVIASTLYPVDEYTSMQELGVE